MANKRPAANKNVGSSCAQIAFLACLRMRNVQGATEPFTGMFITKPPVSSIRTQLDQLNSQLEILTNPKCKADFVKAMIPEVKRAIVALPTSDELKDMTNAQISSRMVQIRAALVRAESVLGRG